MRIILPFALMLATGVACGQAPVPPAKTAPDPGSFALAADAEARWVPFELTPGNQIRFAMTVDGRPVGAVLDTGVSVTVLSRASALVDPARLTQGGEATAIGGRVAIAWLPTREVAIGGLTRRGGAVAVTELPALATGSRTAVDLLVGRDLLAGHALDIDYAAKRFRLLPSGRLPFVGKAAPLTVSPQRQVYESAMAIGGRRLAPMIVDTGDGSSVTLDRAAWDQAGLAKLRTTTAIAYGLAGPLETILAIAPRVTLGELETRAVEVRAEGAGGFSQAVGAAGRIGSGFLQNYRVLLDPGAGHMVRRAGPGADALPLRSTSGLLLGIERDRLKVIHVMANGPAAASGWRAGDTICTIDGAAVAADYATSAQSRWSVGAPGTVVRLGLCGGTERRLVLADFY